jgi:hypothetical protein
LAFAGKGKGNGPQSKLALFRQMPEAAFYKTDFSSCGRALDAPRASSQAEIHGVEIHSV